MPSFVKPACLVPAEVPHIKLECFNICNLLIVVAQRCWLLLAACINVIATQYDAMLLFCDAAVTAAAIDSAVNHGNTTLR
jgi:hypothetical protein